MTKKVECLNVECSNPVTEGAYWCCMGCKRKFLLLNYSDGQSMMWFKEESEDFRERQKKVLKEIEDSGLSISDFLRTLGRFKKEVVYTDQDCKENVGGLK